MFKKDFILVAFFLTLITSCSNYDVAQRLLNGEHLKGQIESIKENSEWTKELEKNRLGEKIASMEYVSSGISLTPEALTALDIARNHSSIFPRLDGFGSLDISDNDVGAMKVVNDFLLDLCQLNECESYFDENSIFSLVLFLNDARDADFNNAFWYVGKAIVFDNALEIPARIVSKNEALDVKFYLKEILQTTDVKEEALSEEDVQQKNEPEYKYKIIDLELVSFKQKN